MALLVKPDLYWLLEFLAFRISKAEAMRELGITTIQELRMRMANYNLEPPRVPRTRAEEMVADAMAQFPIRRRKT